MLAIFEDFYVRLTVYFLYCWANVEWEASKIDNQLAKP